MIHRFGRVPLVLTAMLVATPSLASGPGPKTAPGADPVFVPAGPLAPRHGVFGWLATHPEALVRLPVTLWLGPAGGLSEAAFGLALQPDAGVTLNDAALGISLADRARQACGATSPCTLWLTGSWRVTPPPPRPLEGLVNPGAPGCGVRTIEASASVRPGVLDVVSVGPRVNPDVPPPPGAWFEVARPASCLAIRTLSPVHCARGATRCRRCAAASRSLAVPTLLDLCPDGPAARPTVPTTRDGLTVQAPFDVLRTFATPEEARAFAAAHGITDVAP